MKVSLAQPTLRENDKDGSSLLRLAKASYALPDQLLAVDPGIYCTESESYLTIALS